MEQQVLAGPIPTVGSSESQLCLTTTLQCWILCLDLTVYYGLCTCYRCNCADLCVQLKIYTVANIFIIYY